MVADVVPVEPGCRYTIGCTLNGCTTHYGFNGTQILDAFNWSCAEHARVINHTIQHVQERGETPNTATAYEFPSEYNTTAHILLTSGCIKIGAPIWQWDTKGPCPRLARAREAHRFWLAETERSCKFSLQGTQGLSQSRHFSMVS